MNRSYTENDRFCSDNGIYEAFYAEVTSPVGKTEKAVAGFLEKLFALIRILCGATARRIAKTVVVTLSLVGMIGVVGAIELGRMSLLSGLGICAVLLAVEYLCLRTKKEKKSNRQA